MNTNLLSKVWAALILLLVMLWSFFLGLDVAASDWRSAIIDGIMLAFWIFLAIFAAHMLVKDAKFDAVMDALENEK